MQSAIVILKNSLLLASIEKRLPEEITVGVRPALSLLGMHNQDVSGLLVIRLTFVEHLCQPVLAVFSPQSLAL